jgi:hypothetical protein
MRNPGTDFHRRAADEAEANAIIRRDKQKQLNADEWRRRARKAFREGNGALASNLYRQATLEVARLYDGGAIHGRDPLAVLAFEISRLDRELAG